jgi:hypothetical protein
MKSTQQQPDLRDVTAQPPADGYAFVTEVPFVTERGSETTVKRTCTGCFRTPKRPGAE